MRNLWRKLKLKFIKKTVSNDAKKLFTDIYTNNRWEGRESKSGTGSEYDQTRSLIAGLEKLFKNLRIKSVLDIPCGDFNWMQKVDLSEIIYTGADIVENLIITNRELYNETNKLRFEVLDIIKDPLPKSDIIIVRDCFVHFSYADFFIAIENIKSSGCNYLLTTTFTNRNQNHDIRTGGWRTINLQKKPYNFPDPILVINENCTEGNGKFNDKSMALWKIT